MCSSAFQQSAPSWEFPQYQRVLYIFFIAFSVMINSYGAQLPGKQDKLRDNERPECSPVYSPNWAPLCLPGLTPPVSSGACLCKSCGGSVSVPCMDKGGHCLSCSMNVQGPYPCFLLHMPAGSHVLGTLPTILPLQQQHPPSSQAGAHQTH